MSPTDSLISFLGLIILAAVVWLALGQRKVLDRLERIERELAAQRQQAPAAPQAARYVAPPAQQATPQQPPIMPGTPAQVPVAPVAVQAPQAPQVTMAQATSQPQAFARPQAVPQPRAPGRPPVPPRPVVYQQPPTAPAGTSQRQQAPRRSVESVLGTNVLGAMAALLVFVGLVLLAILVMPTLTAAMRCGAMVVLSLMLAAAGVVAINREKTPFAQALLGCGMGATFISILVSHVYFGLVGEVPAMALLVAWLGLCFALTRRYQSAILSVIAQVGMAVSVCLAYWGGFGLERLPFVVCYQLAACAIVIYGTTRCIEGQQVAGLFSSMGASLVASAFIEAQAVDALASTASVATLGAACVTQLVGTTALAAMVCRAATRGLPSTGLPRAASRHTAALACWLVAVLIDAFLAGAALFDLHARTTWSLPPFGDSGAALFGARLALGCVALAWAALVILHARGRLAPVLARRSVACMAVGTAAFLLMRLRLVGAGQTISLAVVVGIGLWASGAALKDPRLRRDAVAFLAADALLMLLGGYDVIAGHTGWLGAVAYLAALLALLYAWWATLGETDRTRLGGRALLAGLVCLEASLPSALASVDSLVQPLVACAAALAVLVAVSESRLDERVAPSRGIGAALEANNLVVMGASCLAVASFGPAHVGQEAATLLPALICVGLCLALVTLLALRLAPGDASWRQVAYGIAVTCLAAATVEGFAGGAGGRYMTLVCMAVALACIALGFRRLWRRLRLYGLVLTMCCVLKLVLFDMGHESSVAGVVSFIVGGLICFAVSALYSYAVRRLGDGLGMQEASREAPAESTPVVIAPVPTAPAQPQAPAQPAQQARPDGQKAFRLPPEPPQG